MLGYRDLLMQQEHANELLHQAEKERFLRQVLASAHRNPLHCRALTWLGSHLVAWGHSLEQRYGATASAS
jgi:hypothetical protein